MKALVGIAPRFTLGDVDIDHLIFQRAIKVTEDT